MSSVLYQVVTNSEELLNQFDLLKIEATLYDSKGHPISRRDSVYLKFLIYIKSLTTPIKMSECLKDDNWIDTHPNQTKNNGNIHISFCTFNIFF